MKLPVALAVLPLFKGLRYVNIEIDLTSQAFVGV